MTQPTRRRTPSRPRPASRSTHRPNRPSRPRPPQESELDRALAAAAAAPAPEPRTFAQLGLPDKLVSVLARRKIDAPFAIQARALPDALAGRDVLGRARTGSGKTLAFGLPALVRLAQTRPAVPKAPRGLVLVPTRELAKQVADVLAPLGQPLGLKVAAVFGGAPLGRQIDQLRHGVDLVVATPGRLIDLVEREAARLDRIEITVLDEADHMADLGFMPAVTRILDETPTGGQRLLFSATLDRGVDRLVRSYLDDPAVHAVAEEGPIVVADHRVFVLPFDQKLPVAAEIAGRPGRTLFFVRTKHGADRLARQLNQAGADAAAIHGNLRQNQRQRVLDGFAAGRPRVLVATDVAARGIHVDDVDLVVHFDPPSDHKDYLHRSGRTARAGAGGTVLALTLPDQVREVNGLLRAAGVTATTDSVSTGDDAVRAIADSGEPIVVPPPRRPSAGENGPRPGGRRPHRRRPSRPGAVRSGPAASSGAPAASGHPR